MGQKLRKPLNLSHRRLSKEWDAQKNFPQTPKSVHAGSTKEVSWICKQDKSHQCKAKITNRVAGTGCPYCAEQRPSKTYNLNVKSPIVAAQWHPTKNEGLLPEQFLPKSGKKGLVDLRKRT